MPTYSVTHYQVTDNHPVFQTLEATDISVGQSVTVAQVPQGLSHTYQVLDTPSHKFLGLDSEGDFQFDYDDYIPNQILVYRNHPNVDRTLLTHPGGTLTWTPTCTWISNADVVEWLGIATATSNDTAFITSCVAAANAYASRRRREAGYYDSLTTVPGGDVKLGTVMFAGSLYRERGSVDSFASFEQMGTPVPFGANGQINRLLGINRSQVA